MTIQEALNLHEDSMILLSFVLGKDKAWILANQDINLTTKQLDNLTDLIKKREDDWPVAYLTGKKEFYGLEFSATPDVLIPRPESELLIELTLDKIQNAKFKVQNVIDIGTGSGNIIISMAKILTSKEYDRVLYHTPQLIGVDISDKALAVAKKNAEKHGVADKIEFLRGNLLDPLIQNTKYEIRNTILLANLPYLTTKQLNNLTIKHEPGLALAGGSDGLKYYNQLLQQLSRFSILNSVFHFEHDPAQKNQLRQLIEKTFPKARIKFHKDLAGLWRVAEIGLLVQKKISY